MNENKKKYFYKLLMTSNFINNGSFINNNNWTINQGFEFTNYGSFTNNKGKTITNKGNLNI